MSENISDLLNELKTNPQAIARLERLVEDCVNAYDVRQAKSLVRPISNASSSSPTKIREALKGLASKLGVLALPSLYSSEEMVAPFRSGFIYVLKAETPDPAQRLRTKLLDYWIGDRDQVRQEIFGALHENNDVITTASVATSRGDVPGTISNWLAAYDQRFGIELVDSVNIASFLYKDGLTKHITDQERTLLSKLIKFYEYVKLSSQSPLGVEEELFDIENGKIFDFNQGKPRPIVELIGGKLKRGNRLEIFRTSVPAPALLGTPNGSPRPVVSEGLLRPTPVPNAAPTQQVMSGNSSTAVVTVPHAPITLRAPGPVLMFDEQDEREADTFRDKGIVGGAATLEQQLRALAEDVTKRHNFSFKDESNKRRFINLFVSRLKDVRSVVDVRETLLKSVDVGGLGLTSDKVEQVLKILESAKQQYEAARRAPPQPNAPAAPSKKPVSPIDKLVNADIAQFLLKPTPPTEQAKAVPKLEVSAPRVVIEHATIVVPPPPTPVEPAKAATGVQPPKPVAPPTPAVPRAPLPPGGFTPDRVQEWRQEMLKEIARVAPPVVPPKPVAAPTPIPTRTLVPDSAPLPPVPPTANGRPQLTDIKAPHTVGPIGELKSLNLIDFRRLGPVLQALDRVRAKIDLIGETSITKRLEAVRAWQASPVYQLYLRLGRESIENGKAVADLTAELDARGEEVLTEAEFNAVADFNAKLRF